MRAWSRQLPRLAPADAEHGYTSDGRTEWETLLPGGTTLYVSGTVSNQGAFYLQFDAIVLLTAPADVLLRRIRNVDRRQRETFLAVTNTAG